MNKSTTMLLGCLGCVGLPILGCGGLMLVGMFEEGVSKSQKASQERRAEAAARERAPGLAKEMEEFIAVGNWSEAGRVHAELMAADPLYPGLKEAWTQIEPGYRKVEVPKWIAEAQAVATAKEKCAEPKAISDVWKNLRKVKSTDSDFAKAKTAAGQLEKCRARAEREMDATMESIFLDQRKKVANEIEMKFLDEGINTSVTLQGAPQWQGSCRDLSYFSYQLLGGEEATSA